MRLGDGVSIMATQQTLTISKLDAAKRQLETVIRLYFSDADPVAMHTLTGAAYNVLRDITSKRGAEPMFIKDEMFKFVNPGYEKTIREKVNEAENFFKHADRDHASTLDFNPDATELLLQDACHQYQKLTGEQPPLFSLYRTWFMAQFPDMYVLPEETKRALRELGPSVLRMGRRNFFDQYFPQIMALK